MDKKTKSLEIMTGNPKKAVIKLAIPMMIGMLVQTLYNLVDGIWVAGLGPDALSAIGLFFPFSMAIIALGAGLGVGVSSSVARKIGADDKKGADNAAEHGILISIATSLLIMVITLPFIKKVFHSMGAGENVVNLSTQYANVLLYGVIVVLFTNIANGILRGEGDTKRTMYAMLAGSILNIILDPIFIYVLKMGVIGAAWATLLSMVFSAVLIFSWLFIKKDTYVSFQLCDFKFDQLIFMDIIKVGVPSSLAQLSMSFAMFGLNLIIIKAGGDMGIAVFTSAWRIIMFAIVPLLGLSASSTSVIGAAFGAKDAKKLKTAYFYSIRIGIIIEAIIFALIFLFPETIALVFAYTESSKNILKPMAEALKYLSLFIPTIPLGMLTASLFQGIGEGYKSMLVTFLRTIVMQLLFAYLFSLIFDLGLKGIWLGMASGNVIAALIGFSWGFLTVKKMENKKEFQQT